MVLLRYKSNNTDCRKITAPQGCLIHVLSHASLRCFVAAVPVLILTSKLEGSQAKKPQQVICMALSYTYKQQNCYFLIVSKQALHFCK